MFYTVTAHINIMTHFYEKSVYENKDCVRALVIMIQWSQMINNWDIGRYTKLFYS